eukprot:CAMPEP_0172447758 /NCGR_PEP_ID=MMETSP1065-20121228/6983_1 /TAXON_ID=265537 /ORGANISM="Amphiprora paludosa, Strain CCMP125" /LENGTH=160 /DNA_ID=CAMNT_0013199127 /DNA_START=16 /DNA_END=498 /DNA_ORIENTATION=+
MGANPSKTTSMTPAAQEPPPPNNSMAAATSTIAAPSQLLSEPPKPRQQESFLDKAFRKFTEQPLVPIGCVGTAYFLISGLKSFSNRDPYQSQKMMRNRVAAQFATLMAFMGYMGIDAFDFRLAPMTQEKEKYERMMAEQAAAEQAMATATTTSAESQKKE